MIQEYLKDDGTWRRVDTESGNNVLVVQPSDKVVVRAIATVSRTDVAAKNLFVLPPNAIPIHLKLYIATASDAGTTATLSIGKTGTNTYFLSAFDVKGNSGQQSPSAVSHLAASVGTSSMQVVGIYAETGTASTVGSFTVMLEYYLT